MEKSEAIEEKEKLNCELDRLLSEDDERTNALKNELIIRLKEERVKTVTEIEEAESALNERMNERRERIGENSQLRRISPN